MNASRTLAGINHEATTSYLPPLPKPPAREMRGPTPWSNWAIKGSVIAGAFPASMDDQETDDILRTLLEVGVTTFVCLQSEFSIDVRESDWRAGRALRPYIHDAQRLLRHSFESSNPSIRQSKVDFLHLSIEDGGVTSDAAMDRLAEDCIDRIRRGELLYIHCWGGHGRTGTLVAVILGRLYQISYAVALHCTQTFHDARRFPQGVRSPSTAVQRAQVRRLLAKNDGRGTTPVSTRTSRPVSNMSSMTSASRAPVGLVAQPQGFAARKPVTPRHPAPVAPPAGQMGAAAPARGATPRAGATVGAAAGRSAASAGAGRVMVDMNRLSASIESLRNLSLATGGSVGAAARRR